MVRKYSEQDLRTAVENSISIASALKYLGINPSGGSRQNFNRSVEKFSIDTSHFLGQGHYRGSASPVRKTWDHFLVLGSKTDTRVRADVLRRSMIEYGMAYSCTIPNCPTHDGWVNGEITFEIDHINGESFDNRPHNLRFLCPNCHSQQQTSSHSWKNTSGYSVAILCSCGKIKSSTRSETCRVCYTSRRREERQARVAQLAEASE